jgi:hypothetical protein
VPATKWRRYQVRWRGCAGSSPVALSALILFGCGGDGGNGDGSSAAAASPADIVAAVETTAATGSVALDMTLEFNDSSSVPDGTTIDMTGSSTLGDPRRAELSADFEALGVGRIEMLIEEDQVYMRGGVFDDLLSKLPAKREWLFVDLSSSDPAVDQFRSLSTGQNNASHLLYFLLGSPGQVREVGTEEVDGVSTTHYALTADLDRALAEAPAEVADSLRANIEELEAGGVQTKLDADVWVDDERLIRQVGYVYRLSDSGGGGQMTATVTLSGFGEPIEFDVPDPNQVAPVTQLQGL